MTNTYINVGGHKVTTNKVGTVHIITSGFVNGYSGTIVWCVNNGVCTVTAADWGRTSGDGRIIGFTGLPPSKQHVYTQLGIYGNLGIDTSGNLSLYQSSGSLTNIFQTITYPVADDWVES